MEQHQISDTKWARQASLTLLFVFFVPVLLLAQTDAVTVTALNPAAEAASLYSVEFTLSDTLYPDAEFEVTFPAAFDVSNVTIAGSKAINGGFAVEVQGQKVLVKRKGEGAKMSPGEQVDVMFSTVTNPASPDVTQQINVTLKNSQDAIRTRQLRGSILISDKKVQ